MKLICVSILFACALTASFSQWILIASFDINQKYIATELCENRNHPEKHCNGHCFLCKQLNNQEKPLSNANTNSKEKTSIQLFSEETIIDNLTIIPANTIKYSPYKPGIPQEYILSFFQPPQV